MAATVTSNMRIHAAKQFDSSFSDGSQSIYLFIARTLPWENDNQPPTPLDCEGHESATFREMLSMKRLNGSDVSLVIPRNNWTVGTIYTQYANDVDLFDPTSGNTPFFVVTDSLNVYKCLSNNGGAASTVIPSGTSTSVVTNADGYQWKYMFTVNSADVLKFVTTEWIPVKTLDDNDGSQQWLVQQAAIAGTIDRIDMVTVGTQYTQVPTVAITGDGTGATAVATISGGNVTKITVTSTGSGYTWATIAITDGGVASNGATAKAIISPFTGHGANPTAELGGYYVLVNGKLTYDESGVFTIGNDYRRIGMLKNPKLHGTNTQATGATYDQSVRLTFSTVSGSSFVQDEVVTGATSGAYGVVMDWNATTSVLRLVEVSGTFIPGETVVGDTASGVLQTFAGTATSGTTTTIVLPSGASAVNDQYTGQTIKITSGTGNGQTRVISGYVGVSRTATVSAAWSVTPDNTSQFKIAKILGPDVKLYSGEILYFENRRPIERAQDQVEDVKIVVEF